MTMPTAPQPNGASWAYPITHEARELLASASRTSSGQTDDQTNQRHKGIRLLLDVTAASTSDTSTPTLDVKLQGKDPVSGKYYDVPGAAFVQKTGTGGPDSLVVYPGVAETANESVSDVLPETWRVVYTLGGTDVDFTFSVGMELIG